METRVHKAGVPNTGVRETRAPEGGFGGWLRGFEEEARARAAKGDPDWRRGARLHPSVIASLQRFQVGEDGDGAFLIAKADRAGDPEYTAAARLFVAEERNHARMLALLLEAAGAPTIGAHWSDAVFVRARRSMGLRMELLVLMVAEVAAVAYYRALYEGTADPLAAEVARRLVEDEERHIPFHCARLSEGMTGPAREAMILFWRALVAGGALVVAAGHGRALLRLGSGPVRFARDVLSAAAAAAADMRG